MTRTVVLVPVLVILACLAARGAAIAQEAKPTLAIADVAVSPGGWTIPPPQLGGAIIDLLVNELVVSDQFRVYDGQWLVPEAEIGGRVDLDRLREAAAEKHVDYVVLGSLIGFSTEHRTKRGGGLLPKPLILGGFSREQARMEVRMVFRVIEVRTGVIVATAEAEGLGVRRATSVGGGGLLRALPLVRGLPLLAAAHVATKLPAARDAMLNEAVGMAVHKAAQALAASATRLVRP